MSKYEFLQPRFTEGVLAKSLQGRSSEDFYKNGFKASKNMIPLISGPLVKRPGTNFIGEALNSTSRFIPFFKDQDNTYIIEIAFYETTGSGASEVLAHCKLRFWSQDQLLGSYNSSNVLSTTPYLITTTAWNTLIEVNALKMTQSGDLVFVTCPTKRPQRISRTLVTAGTASASDRSVWTVSEFVMEDGPFNSIKVYSKIPGKTAYSLSVSGTETEVPIAKVSFNTANNSFVLAGHGLQTGMKVKLAGSWGNITTDGNKDGSTVVTDTQMATVYVINSDATSFQVSTADDGDPFEFQLKKETVTGVEDQLLPPVRKTDASVTVSRYEYAVDSTITVTIHNLSSGTNANILLAKNLLTSGDDGRQIRINPLSKPEKNIGGIRWAWGTILTYTSNTSSATTAPTFTVKLKTALSTTRGTYGTPEFRLGAFSDSQGWPQVSQIYQQRMVLAANTFQPSSIWLSKTGDFYSFAPTQLIDQDTPLAIQGGVSAEIITNANGLTFTLDSDTLDVIKWLGEGKKLAMGTSAGVYMLYGSETNLVVTPFRFTINRETSFSATDVLPVLVSNSVIYAQIGGKEIQQLSLNKGLGGQWDASKISLKGYDIIKSSSITKMVWQERPNGIIWCLMADGRLLTLCFDFRLEFLAWAEHTIGGTNAKVLDIDVLPRSSHDQIWMKVSREVGGVTKYHVETLGRFPSEGALTRNDYVFSDSAVTKDVASDKIINGITHLVAEDVQIYYDGMQHVNKTVSATGTVTLTHDQGSRAVAGLPYTAEIDTLEPSAPENQFSYSKRLIKIAVIIEESLGIQLDYNDLSEELLFRTMSDFMGRQIPLFSGTRKLSLSGIGWDTHTVKISSNGPLPMQINALILEAETGGS